MALWSAGAGQVSARRRWGGMSLTLPAARPDLRRSAAPTENGASRV